MPPTELHWLFTREMVLTYLIAILTTLIALYSNEVRRAFKIPVYKIQEAKIRSSLYHITLLTRLHNNPYRLLLYCMWFVADLMFFVVLAGLLSSVVPFAVRRTTNTVGSDASLWLIVGGAILGKTIGLQRVVKGLYYFEEVIQEHKERLSKLQASDDVWAAVQLVEDEVVLNQDRARTTPEIDSRPDEGFRPKDLGG